MYALITGGTKGIGRAVAECLAKSGYNLILTYGTDTETAHKTCSELTEKHAVEATAIKADSAATQSIDVIAHHVESHNIRLNAIVFNAGLTNRESFEKINIKDWENVFYANIHFPVFLLQRLLEKINSGGCVVFTGSLMGIIPHAMSLSYGVTKSAVHALAQNLVKFLAPYNIRINAVAPGFVDTEWQKNKPEEIRKNIENKIAIGRFCDPDELAEVYKLIIENSYINGEVITVDGGYCFK
ncbi:MAG: SDR family oxidoreductase [Tannerella sp.]|jgi:3-oxoacyl-[acyl-carrier protein] reductase|nr:SDR family oxidoreductase [Tannerella sp.]